MNTFPYLSTPELPAVNAARCTGCGECVAVCPTDCLEMKGPLPWLPRPADCISCTLCVLICPADALEMVDEVVVTQY
jgi:formate hydrogenlyase subunit 6/NADH:ubiquinone oxidoreductase subunit I